MPKMKANAVVNVRELDDSPTTKVAQNKERYSACFADRRRKQDHAPRGHVHDGATGAALKLQKLSS